MKFEKHLEAVKKNIKDLSSDELSLQDALKVYKSGLLELKEARKCLDDAKLSIKKIEDEVFG